MNPLDFVSGIVKPLGDTLDNLITSDEERLKLSNELKMFTATMADKIADREFKLKIAHMELLQKRLDAQSKVIIAEANGGSMIQRIWRPISMLTFLFLVVCDSFGWLAFRLSDQAWILLTIGLGGYTGLRTGEKLGLPIIKEKMEEKREQREERKAAAAAKAKQVEKLAEVSHVAKPEKQQAAVPQWDFPQDYGP